MWELLSRIYLINGTLLIDHEIDSAYWREWNLFRLPGGIGAFVLIHLPVLFLILWGIILLERRSVWGIILSIILGLSGIFAFAAHAYFIKRGHPEFRSKTSISLLLAILLVSLLQVGTGLRAFLGIL
ncbi:MAG: hypothetical protein JRH13_08145 [Deltaproteobacteria bacterium]|nr:hypothetical protein [Deltaproteobacteria bacterium]MBW2129323.1 hypothetical protein [Deltaproteobacteria bacterium]MBW2304228.1 hypothetical protein [Deltaproteobacteria bacterium]